MSGAKRWCFVCDDDCHNYLIPADRAAEFNALMNEHDDDTINEDFTEYRCNSIEGWTFTDPKPR